MNRNAPLGESVAEPGQAAAAPHDLAAQPDKPTFLRKHRWRALGALVVVGVLGMLAVRWWLGTPVATEPILRRDFVQTIVASGHVEAPHRVDVGAQITGKVMRIPVAEGQSVKAGDVLVELEAAELSAAGRQADVAVLQAQARLRKLQEVQAPVAAQTLRQAQATLANARAAQARSQELFDKGFIGQAALDDARKTGELADAQMLATQKQLEGTGITGSDRALAVADVAGARASAQAARARAGYAVITAPLDGTLIARSVEVGDVVQPGKVLMTLSPRGATQLVVQIDEKNLALLALGQSALVSADAYAKQLFAATVGYINPGVNATTGAVEVKLDVASPPAVLKQDMTVSIDIEVARRRKALIVPLAAVRDADTAAAWVLRVEGRHAVRRAVHIGLRSGGLAELIDAIDGLVEGDSVVTAPTTLTTGARIRAAAVSATASASASAPR